MIDVAAQRPDKFDLDKLLWQCLGRVPRQGNLRRGDRVHQGSGQSGHGNPLAQDPGSKALPDGRAVLSFQVDGLDEILWWVLAWSGRAGSSNPRN